LLVALFSVLATLFAIGIPWLRPRGSDIKVIVESLGDKTLTALARNDGLSSGFITLKDLEVVVRNISHQSFGDSVYIVWLSHEGQLIESGKEARLVAQVMRPRNYSEDLCIILKREKYFERPAAQIERWAFNGYEGLSCQLQVNETSFDSSRWMIRTGLCTQLQMISQCVFGYTLHQD
jgi:hypothetical protein